MRTSFDSHSKYRSFRAIACSLLATLAIAGCDDDDDGSSLPAVVATADTLTIASGTSADLLANDTIGGAAASVTTTPNVSFSVTGELPTGVTAANGVVAVAADAAPGTLSLSYTICDLANTGNCATATATVTIPAPAIVATADSFTLPPGTAGDLLANDTLGAAPATATTVTFSSTASTLPSTATVSAAGLVSVGAGTAAGVYTVDYTICQTAAATNCASAVATITVPDTVSMTGTALDSATGLGIPGVTVSAQSVSTTTDASGHFTLPGVTAGDRLPVRFTSALYAETTRITAVSATGTTDVQARMVHVAAQVVLPVTSGGTATVAGSTAQVVLPPNAVQRADGSVPTGDLTVNITPIDPASDSTVMPGDFTTLAADGTASPIESFGALTVTLQDSAGAALNLASGQTATIRIPVASRNASTPATIPLYFFDPASGRWTEQGTATLADDGSGAYYQGSVSHFTTWNADQTYNTVRITGCVADAAGTPVANAQVQSDGVDYSGTSSALTDASGNFTLALRLNSSATVVGLSGGRLTNTLRAGPYGADAALPACLVLGDTGAGITMKLTWGVAPSDLDSHLFAPSGFEVYYGSKGSLLADPFANLDVDDTSSYGPEVVTITRLMVGTYKYSINNYSGYGSGPITASGARVELNIPGRTLELFTPPTGETSSTNWWNLFEFDVDATCSVTVRRVGTFTESKPTVVGATPTYCTPP